MNKKGFTLIELLAVIVILAVIALIVTPIVTGIIKQSKDSANLRSAEGYYSSVKNKMLNNFLGNSKKLEDGIYSVDDLDNLGLEYSGARPTNGTIVVINNELLSAELSFNSSKIIIDKNGSAIYLSDSKVYGLKWDGNDNYTRLESAQGMTSCVGTDTDTCISDFDNAEIYGDIKDVIVDGNAFVYIPKFYIKKVVTGDTWEWYISKDKKDDNYYLPECFHDVENNIELPYILVGKYNASLDETGTKLESKSSTVPLVKNGMTSLRNYALANNNDEIKGYHLIDIHTVDVIQTLFYIEYGTLNSQKIMAGFTSGINPRTTNQIITAVNDNTITVSSGMGTNFATGQLIDIASTAAGRNVATNLKITNIDGDIVTVEDTTYTEHKALISIGNFIYNVANISGQTNAVKGNSGSIISNTTGKYSMKYRGIENIYGNIWEFIDGVNINDNKSTIVVDRNYKTYASNKIDGDYKTIGYAKYNTECWPGKMGYDINNPFIQFPIVYGGGTDKKYGDYYYMKSTSGIRTVMWGGNWHHTTSDGINSYMLYYDDLDNDINVGSRIIKSAIK